MAAEEIGDFKRSHVFGIGSVDNVMLNVGAKIAPEGPGPGFAGIGRPHEVPMALDDPFPFEYHHHDRAGGHEGGQAVIKRAITVHLIEGLGLSLGQANLPHG